MLVYRWNPEDTVECKSIDYFLNKNITIYKL